MKKFTVPILLTIVIAAVLVVLVPMSNFVPKLASAEGAVIDNLLTLEMQIIAGIFTFCMVFFFYSIFVHRRRGTEIEYGESFHGNTTLEIVWTIVPTVAVIWLGIYGATKLNEITDKDTYDMEVIVTGRQWSWNFEYPDSGIVTDELVLQEDTKVLFTIKADDVIHSFWVPEFRVKQDAVPGIETSMVITPTEIGTYRVRCAELCGRDHYNMYADVTVMTETSFDAWVAENSSADLSGEELAQVHGCVACHSVDGTVIVGPSWLGIFGSEETLEGGETVLVDEAYLFESITDPGAKLVEGFPGVMPPNYAESIGEEDINKIIDYIVSLGE